jgi:hypothetical protein
MARGTEVEENIPARPRANAAVTLAVLALLVAIAGLVMALGARNRADTAVDTANKTEAYTKETVEKSLNEANKATPGGGIGTDSARPADPTPYPTVNGQ